MKDAAIFYVYIIFRPWDGSPCYLGKGKGDRWLDHWRPSESHPNPHLMSILKKAKRLGLEVPKIKVRENLTESEAFEIERTLIAAIGRGKKGPLVNLTDGGEGTSGWTHTPEWRALMSKIMKGRPGPKGRKPSPETKAKIAATIAARTEEEREAIGAKISAKRSGQTLSLEHRLKLSVAHTDKKLSREHVDNIVKGNTGKKRSKETRERMSIAQQKIAAQMREIVRERWEDTEYRAKAVASMSIAALGNKRALGVIHTAKSRANMSEGQRRRAPPSEQTRAKMSARCKENWEKPEYRAMMLEARKKKAAKSEDT